VLHSPIAAHARVVIFFGGLGTTKEKFARSGRRTDFESANAAVIYADHYNEGERRDASLEPVSNRSGWSKCQKNMFWRAIQRTAEGVPLLVDFALRTYGADAQVYGYGASMGGDILLAAMVGERRLHAVAVLPPPA